MTTKRNVNQELAFYDIEDSSLYNAFVILMLLRYMPRSTLNQLARACYLIRFTKVLSRLLTGEMRDRFLAEIREWEFGNLDMFLSPYINRKYDERFIRGIKELYAKDLISFEDEHVVQIEYVEIPVHNDLFKYLDHKATYAGMIVLNSNINELDEQINEIVGEEQWRILFTSTGLQ